MMREGLKGEHLEGGTRLKVLFSIADSLTITLVDIKHLLLIIDF